MKAPAQILLTAALVAVGLWVYDALQERPARGSSAGLDQAALESRIDALAQDVRSLEDRIAAAADPSPEAAAAEGPLREVEIDRLESIVREIERRKEIERLSNGARARLDALGLELTEAQRKQALALIVGFEAERADLWRQVRHEAIADKDEIARRFAPIRDRYEASIRHALPERAARAIIEAALR